MKICNLELKSYRQFLREQKLPEDLPEENEDVEMVDDYRTEEEY